MKKPLILISIIVGSYANTICYGAETSFFIIPKIALGTNSWQLTADFGLSGEKLKIDNDFQMIEFAISGGYQDFYVSVNYEQSIDDRYETSINDDGSVSEISWRRVDYGTTLGYNVWQRLNLFGGYKRGYSQGHAFGIKDLGGGNYNLVSSDLKLTETGPFLGLGYDLPIGQYGIFGATVAYANFDGQWVMKDTSGSGIELDGDTTGFSYGLTWSGRFSETVYYSIGAKRTNYIFTTIIPTKEELGDITWNERFTILKISLSKEF